MNIKKIIWVIIGLLSLAIGTIAAVIPLLPAFPFILLSVISFSHSSQRLKAWLLNSNLYRDNLQGLLSKQGMTLKAKIRLTLTLSITMAIGLYFVSPWPWAMLILGLVWSGHLYYFWYKVKLVEEN